MPSRTVHEAVLPGQPVVSFGLSLSEPCAGGYDAYFDLSGLTVTAYRRANLGGAHMTTVKRHVDYRIEETVAEPVRRKVKLSWTKPLVLDLDPRNKTGAYTIRGELTKREPWPPNTLTQPAAVHHPDHPPHRDAHRVSHDRR